MKSLRKKNATYRDAEFVHHTVFICKFHNQWAVISDSSNHVSVPYPDVMNGLAP